MINDQNTIYLFGKPLFSLLAIETPMNDRLPIPSSACLCYIVEGENQAIDPMLDIKARKDHFIMSVCGITLGHMLSNQQPGKSIALIVYFLPEHLKTVFSSSKPPHWKEIESPVSKYVVQMAANNLIKNYIDGIQQFFDNKIALTEELLVLKLKELITLLLQTDDSSDILKMVRSLFSEREFSFREIIDAHLFEPLSVYGLSQLVGMSLSAFKKKFKEIYDNTPGAYIVDKRTEEVAKQLLISDLPISQIGYSSGFSSPAHLSKCFKKKYGISPKVYRQNFLDKE